MPTPFILFPWDKPFLEEVQSYICQNCGHDLGRVTIVTPHSRPRRYLTDLFYADKSLPRPVLLPRMLTLGELMQDFQRHSHSICGTQKIRREAALLDGVYMLFLALKRMCQEQMAQDPTTYERSQLSSALYALQDLAKFLPWGIRLYTLFEECMQQLAPIQNIAHAEGEVSPMAAELLAHLAQLHRHYLDILEEEGFTTAGCEALAVANALQTHPEKLPPRYLPSHAEHVFLVGFNTLTESEDMLLKSLWKNGARVCIHSDPKLLDAEEHFACQDHAAWLKRWKASCTLAVPASGQKPQIHFVSAYDVHSQLLALQKKLTQCYSSGDNIDSIENNDLQAAIVLTSPSLLMPTLHHLPKDIAFNVSMGYPLEKSALFSLIEAVMRLQENARQFDVRDEQGEIISTEQRYYWRQFLHCLRHPFVQMLCYAEENAKDDSTKNTRSLRAELGHIENKMRVGERFVSVEDVLHAWQSHPYYTQESLPILRQLFSCLMGNFAAVHSAQSLAYALSSLCQLLLSHGEEFWKRYALDAESMYRLVQHVLPALRNSCLAHIDLPQATLFTLCRQFIGAERVPFEADPITGLQLLGMLETRLLRFEKVFILDATDNALPGFKNTDPLLPDALRPVLGLPGLHERERVMAHTLHRLLACANEVHFYWQENSQDSKLLDDNKSRSRFVDAYLWEEEQKLKRILEPGEAPLHCVTSPLSPINTQAQVIPVTEPIRKKIEGMLTKGISPSALNLYLQCPLQFALKYIYKLKPLDEVNEGDDAPGVGKLLHEVLQKAYAQWENTRINHERITLDYLEDIFNDCLKNNYLEDYLPPQSLVMLRMAGPIRLKAYLQAQQEQIIGGSSHIALLEKELKAPICGFDGQEFYIRGIIDRVDLRDKHPCNKLTEKGFVVLDYKTGKGTIPRSSAWKDMQLLDAIDKWTPQAPNSNELLERVATGAPSLQLLSYLYIFQRTLEDKKDKVLDAAFIELGDSGKEKYLLDGIESQDRIDIINTHIPKLLTFVIHHLHSTEELQPRATDSCKYCSYGMLCQR